MMIYFKSNFVKTKFKWIFLNSVQIERVSSLYSGSSNNFSCRFKWISLQTLTKITINQFYFNELFHQSIINQISLSGVLPVDRLLLEEEEFSINLLSTNLRSCSICDAIMKRVILSFFCDF